MRASKSTIQVVQFVVVFSVLLFLMTVYSDDMKAHAAQFQTEIPFVMNDCNIPSIEVMLPDGQYIWLAVDTGATYTHLDKQYKQKEKAVRLMLNNEVAVTPNVHYYNYRKPHELCGRVQGVLGQDVFSATTSTTFDFENKKLILNY